MNAQDRTIREAEQTQQARAGADLWAMERLGIISKTEPLRQDPTPAREGLSSCQRCDIMVIHNDDLRLTKDYEGNVLHFRDIAGTPMYVWSEQDSHEREMYDLCKRIAMRKLSETP